MFGGMGGFGGMGALGGGAPGDFASFQQAMMQDPAMVNEMLQSPMVRVSNQPSSLRKQLSEDALLS